MLRSRFLAGIAPYYAPEGVGGGGDGGQAKNAGNDGGAAAAGGASAAGGAQAGGQQSQQGQQNQESQSGGQQNTTIAGGAAASAATTAPAKFPDTWRAELAGSDTAFLKTLERYASPTAFAQAHRELITKVSSGELKAAPKPPPEGATPEQLATWRKEQGLPETVEAYVSGIKLPDGVVPGEADKPLIEGFAKVALASGLSQDAVNTATNWFFKTQAEMAAKRDENDAVFHDDSVRAMTEEWGKDFKVNQRVIGNLMSRFAPEGVGNEILGARITLPNGSQVKLGDHPGALKMLVAAGRAAFPAATIVDPATPDALKALSAEKGDIEKLMGDPSSDYWRGPKSAGLRERYRQIVDAEAASAGR